MTFTIHRSLSEIVHRYDGFILDQFGVMHNGKESLPGAVECVKQLSSLGKKLIILSNTSAPSEAALAKLPKLGFDPSHFVGAVTSGEEASRFILEKYGSNADTDADAVASVGKKAIILTWADNLTSDKFLEKCGNVKPTFNYSEADFVLAHGSQVLRNNVSEGDNLSLGSFMENGDLSSIEPILKKCKEHNLDMVCANPDFIVKVGDGSIAHMPGKIAQKYEEMGGVCTTFGKPHEEHFNACLRELELDSNRVAHVGDSLHHDIAGANAAGISNIFITGGIHSEYFDYPVGDMPNKDDLNALFKEEGGNYPTHVAPMFKF